ncbi:kelch-like protein 3 [Mizuhopecten yessoensis]|uniref:kelch-like protein 3 n=1 Tax=Mizuhopecten yessoensis TaxID=6573 RepID=UPI000B45F216|nr:kelch-like protein 3 [Mizuhopecten yessoensis]
MPRFNFSSYYTKDSLTCLSSTHGLNPQEEWENSHKAIESGGSTAGYVPLDVTNSELERSLTAEFNELSESIEPQSCSQKGTKAKRYAESPMLASKGQPELVCNRSGCDARSGLEKCRCITVDSGVSDNYRSLIFDESLCSDDYKSSPRTSTPIKGVCPVEDNLTVSKVTPEVQKTGTQKFRKGLVMVLDELNTLSPVNHQADLDQMLKTANTNEKQMTPCLANVISRLQSLPVDKLTHFSNMGEYMKFLQENQQICDVEIHVETSKFMAHRVALACFSEYFSQVFFKGAEKQKVPLVIRLRGVTSRSFNVFLEWIYTGDLEICPLLVADLLVIAQHLKVPLLEDKCAEFMVGMPLEKSLSVLQSGRVVTCSDLYDVCVSHVSTQFQDVLDHRSFFNLDVNTLCMILSRDDLNITSEIEVFRVALKWIAHDMNERHKHLSKVMSCVRFPYMNHQELFQCFEVTDLLRECHETRNAILHANWLVTAMALRRDDPLNIPVVHPRATLSDPKNPKTRKASSVYLSSHSMRSVKLELEPNLKGGVAMDTTYLSKTGDIIALGAYQKFTKARDNRTVKTVERYNSVKNQWTHYTNLPQPRFHHGTAIVNKKMYIIGGSDPNKSKKISIPSSDAFVYNLETDEWRQIASMVTARMHHVVCSLYGMLYAIGGQDGNSRVLNSVECYNPKTDRWIFVKPMSVARLGMAAAIQDGTIFVVGGYGESVDSKSGLPVLSSVEVFDPRENTWTTKNNLRMPRCHGNLVSVNGELFLCGGAIRSFTTNDSVLTSVAAIDVYNKRSDVWEHRTDMVLARHFTGSTVIGGKIFIIGGVSTVAGRILQSIECYDAINDVWINGVQELPYPARWLSCVALPGKI